MVNMILNYMIKKEEDYQIQQNINQKRKKEKEEGQKKKILVQKQNIQEYMMKMEIL